MVREITTSNSPSSFLTDEDEEARYDNSTLTSEEECHIKNCSLSATPVVNTTTSVSEEQCRQDPSTITTEENDPPPAHKSRHFFRKKKGRRSRSSSPPVTGSSSSSATELNNDHSHHRRNVMDLLRPKMRRRASSLPPPAAITSYTTSSATTSSSSSSSTSNLSSLTDKPKNKRCVTFTNIQIREYNTILGDHPCCPNGPPLALGWEYKHDEVIIGIDDYENTLVDSSSSDENTNGNAASDSSCCHHYRRRSPSELRLNCEDRREILCRLMKPVENDVVMTSNGMMMMDDEEKDDENNEPHLLHNPSAVQCDSKARAIPLYTKEDLRRAERKLDRERRCFTGNAARTKRRLKRGFFKPLSAEEEALYKLNVGGLLGHESDQMDDSSSGSSDEESGVVAMAMAMDISPKK